MRYAALLVAMITVAGCAKSDAPEPVQFAPSVRFDDAPEEMPGKPTSSEERAAEQSPATDAPAPVEEGGDDGTAREERADEFGGAKKESAPKGASLQDAKEAEEKPKAPAKTRSSGAAQPTLVCDAACRKLCDAQVDQQACARAYNAGCFSGTAPATVDCGDFKASGVEKSGDGVERQPTPTVDF